MFESSSKNRKSWNGDRWFGNEFQILGATGGGGGEEEEEEEEEEGRRRREEEEEEERRRRREEEEEEEGGGGGGEEEVGGFLTYSGKSISSFTSSRWLSLILLNIVSPPCSIAQLLLIRIVRSPSLRSRTYIELFLFSMNKIQRYTIVCLTFVWLLNSDRYLLQGEEALIEVGWGWVLLLKMVVADCAACNCTSEINAKLSNDNTIINNLVLWHYSRVASHKMWHKHKSASHASSTNYHSHLLGAFHLSQVHNLTKRAAWINGNIFKIIGSHARIIGWMISLQMNLHN